MGDSKFYFGGFYFLLGMLIGIIIFSNFFLGYVTRTKDLQVLKGDSISNGADTTMTIKKDATGVDKSDKVSLNDKSLLNELKTKGIAHPKIVLAQAKLETGNYTSRVCLTYNNLFGLRKPDGSYYRFNHWRESVKAYKNYVQYKYQPPNDYYQFLTDIGYAEDGAYIRKVKEIANQV